MSRLFDVELVHTVGNRDIGWEEIGRDWVGEVALEIGLLKRVGFELPIAADIIAVALHKNELGVDFRVPLTAKVVTDTEDCMQIELVRSYGDWAGMHEATLTWHREQAEMRALGVWL